MDNFIIVTFICITLFVGFFYGARVTTIRDYALGGRNFSTGVLTATIVASMLSGSGFASDLSKTYSDGFYYIFATLGMPISFFLVGYFLVPRMGEFLGKLSVAEAIGSLYGDKVRVITALAGIASSFGFIAVQFKVFGSVITYFTDLHPFLSILISAGIVIAYSAFGGVKAVTFTDVFQLCAFSFAIPLVGVMIWNNIYYTEASLNMAAKFEHFNFVEVFGLENPKFWSMMVLFFYFLLPGIEPFTFQRISMGRDVSQVKQAFMLAAIIMFVIVCFTQWIPYLIFNIDQNIESNKLLAYLFNNYTFMGFKGLIVSGVIAMAMSTADSNINATSVLFAHDFCGVLKIFGNNTLLISRSFAVIIGICGILLAYYATDILSVVLTASSFYMPIVTVPMIMAILGFRTSTRAVLISMMAGAITVIMWEYVLHIKADCVAFAMLVNLIFLMSSHYILQEKGGWVGIKDKASLHAMQKEGQRDRSFLLRFMKDFTFMGFCYSVKPRDTFSHSRLGMYMMAYSLTIMYITKAELVGGGAQSILVIYQIMLVSSLLFIMQPIWPKSLSRDVREKFGIVIWPIIIFYMLIMLGFFFVLMGNPGSLHFSVFTTNVLVAALMLGWRTVLTMMVAGIYLSITLYRTLYPYYELSFDIGSPAFVASYLVLGLIAVFVMFLKPKEEEEQYLRVTNDSLGTEINHLQDNVKHYGERIEDQEVEINRLEATAQKILNNVNHELRLPIGNVLNFASMMKLGISTYTDSQLKMMSKEILDNTNRVSSMILNMLDLSLLKARTVELQLERTDFSALARERIEICRKLYVKMKDIEFRVFLPKKLFITLDPNYIRQTIDNLIINAIKFSNEKGVISISLEEQTNVASFVISNEGKSIPHTELYDIFKAFKMSSDTESPAGGRGVGLALCKAAVEAHGGMIHAENTQKGAKFRFVLPYDHG